MLKLFGSVVAGGTLTGVAATLNPDSVMNLKTRFLVEAREASSTVNDVNMSHGTKWDQNWDMREPSSLLKPLKKNATPEETEEYNKAVEKMKPKATRFIVMVRHGQYNLEGKEDSQRYLTELGRKQAASTGQRLGLLYNQYLGKESEDENGNELKPRVRLVKSTMTRATETGDIIHQHLPDLQIQPCDLIREGAPCRPDPHTDLWAPEPCDFFQEGARIEAGFRKYFHRAEPTQTEDSFDILVCHGNVIRYCVCRALQLDPAAWLRMSLHNGSITVFAVRPNGRVSVRSVGEAGHFPPDMLTFN